MSNNKNQLSKHIKEVLLEHEEAYVLGSWERFQRYKIRKTNIRKQRLFLTIAASIVLILMFSFAWINFGSIPGGQIVENQSQNQSETIEKSTPSPTPQENIHSHETHRGQLSAGEDDVEKNTGSGFKESIVGNFSRTAPPVSKKSLQKYLPDDSRLLTTSGSPDRIIKMIQATGAFYPAESKSRKAAANIIVKNEDIRHFSNTSRHKDLVFSVAFAPVMNIHDSKADLGSGGGVYTDWNFAHNMTISSGVFIAQNRLNFNNGHGTRLAEDFSQEGPSTLSADDLTSIQIELVNLEIPLNIRYFLNDYFSVSVGISSMAFLKEKYNYNFEYEQRIQVFEEGESIGLRPASRVVTMRTSQTQSEPSLNRMNWAAFYTFSLGYQQEIFKKYSASFEPFIKIPAGEITSRGISYTSGGVQLKISF